MLFSSVSGEQAMHMCERRCRKNKDQVKVRGVIKPMRQGDESKGTKGRSMDAEGLCRACGDSDFRAEQRHNDFAFLWRGIENLCIILSRHDLTGLKGISVFLIFL